MNHHLPFPQAPSVPFETLMIHPQLRPRAAELAPNRRRIVKIGAAKVRRHDAWMGWGSGGCTYERLQELMVAAEWNNNHNVRTMAAWHKDGAEDVDNIIDDVNGVIVWHFLCEPPMLVPPMRPPAGDEPPTVSSALLCRPLALPCHECGLQAHSAACWRIHDITMT